MAYVKNRRRTIEQWVGMLARVDLPVLAHSVTALEALREDGDRLSPQRVTDAVLHDPFMTAKVLRYLQCHRGRRRDMDITTIAHALMMLGLSPFYAHFGAQSVIEDELANDPAILAGVLAVMNRARHAALYACDWAKMRRDVDPEEVMVAALLHDLAEMLLWIYAPASTNEIAAMQQQDSTVRSEAAQQAVLGFHVIDLQLAMVKAWELPNLLQTLMDEHHARNPRVVNVQYAVDVARHSACGWENAALPHDYAAVGSWLGVTPEEVERRVKDVAVHAAADAPWYGMRTLAPSDDMPATSL